MKEAAGEANMTVVTIVLMGIVLGVGTMIVNNLMTNTSRSACCTTSGGVWNSGECFHPSACTYNGSTTTCSGAKMVVSC